MATYLASMSKLLGAEAARLPRAVLYGENINNGSRIVGICRDLQAPEGGRILNVGDCELTHVAAGFGMMMNGVHAVLFVKQLDFMLLAADQFVSTYNVARCSRDPGSLGSFTVVTVVCDQGWQGPQSSFNAMGDLCSLARVPGFTLTNVQDASRVLRQELGKPGFRFIGLSQRLFPTEFLNPGFTWAAMDGSAFQYSEGEHATIVCFNFSLPEGHALRQILEARGWSADLFSANHVFPLDDTRLRASIARTGRLVVLDDSKSTSLAAHALLHEASIIAARSTRVLVARAHEVDLGVSADQLKVDYEDVLAKLGLQDKR